MTLVSSFRIIMVFAVLVSEISFAGICSFVSTKQDDSALKCWGQGEEVIWTELQVLYPDQTKQVHFYSIETDLNPFFSSVSCEDSESKTLIRAKREESDLNYGYELVVESDKAKDDSGYVPGTLRVLTKEGVPLLKHLDCEMPPFKGLNLANAESANRGEL